MEIIFILLLVLIELLLATFSILSQSNNTSKKRIIRIVALLGFFLFVLFDGISWSFRVVLLSVLLVFNALISFVSLLQKGQPKKDYKANRIVLKAVGMVVLLLLTLIPTVLFPYNRVIIKTTGEYHVLTNTTDFIDATRIEGYSKSKKDRKLNVQFWYPDTNEEAFPLIVFSHGGLGVKSSNESLYNELASHGYVVVSIDHTYHSFFTKDENNKTTWIDFVYLQQMLSENPLKDKKQSFEFYRSWMETRMDDINFVIDTVVLKTKSHELIKPYGLIDSSKIGVMGHSLGGSAALGIGRVREDVKAIVALESPFLYDIEDVKDDEFIVNMQDYPLPLLNVYSDSSWNILDKRPQYVFNDKLLNESNPTIFNKHISGIGHLSLTDFSLTSPLLTRFIDQIEPTIAY